MSNSVTPKLLAEFIGTFALVFIGAGAASIVQAGITVPHHLLAADLIARGFWTASSSKIDRVVLLSPDDFSKVAHAFATSLRPFEKADWDAALMRFLPLIGFRTLVATDLASAGSPVC